ncbi:MAG: hypothetical protein DSO04_04615 [Hadesarchaea archaeon]|nr:MAG: hypothetical protein DSO04_04615 [Hadesarchaea archaeon]
MGEKGIAPLVAAVVLLAGIGSATAVPVAASVANVDPDHPLYSLKKVGERIRGLSTAEQMRLRWQEYQRMVEKGKGLQYQGVLKEFVEKLNSVAPYDAPAKQEIVRWMQEQLPGIGEVQLKLALQAAGDNQQLRAEVQEQLAAWRENRDPELLRAWMNHFRERAREKVKEKYEEMDELFENICTKICIQENLEQAAAENRLSQRFAELQEAFENLRLEVEAMLATAPENLPGRVAADRLYQLALKEENLALHAKELGLLGRAVGLMTSAVMHLRNAECILEHAQEWEPEHAQLWQEWREEWEEEWEEIKPQIQSLWENAAQNWQQYRERIRERWEEE